MAPHKSSKKKTARNKKTARSRQTRGHRRSLRADEAIDFRQSQAGLAQEQGEEGRPVDIDEPPATEPEGEMIFLGSIPIGSESEANLGIFATAEEVVPLLPDDVRERMAESGDGVRSARKDRKKGRKPAKRGNRKR